MDARSRLGLSAAAGVVVFIPVLLFAEWQVAILAGWDTTSAVFVALVYLSIRQANSVTTRELAIREDDSRVVSEAILVGASVISLVAVVFALLAARGLQRDLKTGITTLVVAACSSHGPPCTPSSRCGTRVSTTARTGASTSTTTSPRITAISSYVALTLGMTFQVSDTDLTSRTIRRTAIRHALLSYMFGVAVFATTINIVATLLTT